jgi:predicted dehydrogenase
MIGAILGCGSSGQAYLAACVELEGLNKIFVFDESANFEINKFTKNSHHTAKIERLKDETFSLVSTCDFVIVSLPNSLHELYVTRIRELSNTNILCEKPFGTGLESSRRLSKMMRKLDVIGFNYRFNPITEKVMRLINNSPLGQMRSFNARFLKSSWKLQNKTGWRRGADEELSGGATNDLSIHFLNLFEYLSGEELNVSSFTGRRYFAKKTVDASSTDDTGWLSGKSCAGTIVNIEASKCCSESDTVVDMTIMFDFGYIKANFSTGKIELKLAGESVLDVSVDFDSTFKNKAGEVSGWNESFYYLLKEWSGLICGKNLSSERLSFAESAIRYQSVLDRF